MAPFIIFSLVLAVISVGAEPTVSPPYQQITNPGPAVVRCTFPKPLVTCRVRLSEHRGNYFDKVLDKAYGIESPVVPLLADGKVTATFAGHSANECGVSIRLDGGYGFVVLVEFYGLSAGAEWSRGWALVATDGFSVLPTVTPTPRLIVTNPGTNVSVLWKTQGTLDGCYIQTPGDIWVELSTGKSLPSGSRLRRYGASMADGECGATLHQVTANDLGVWRWYGWQGESIGWQATVVLLASAPVGNPVLSVHNATSLRVGDLMTATCRAPPSVPPPKLTWLLDGQVVRHDDGNTTLPGDVAKSWPWEPQGAVQTYTRRLSSQDIGKRLECRAEHSAGVDSDGLVLTLGAGCPALANPSLSAHCKLADKIVDCSVGPVPLGTKAHLECREGSKPNDDDHGVETTRCSSKGWRPKPLACSLDCGLRRHDATPRSIGGEESREGEFPWHVAVFRKSHDSFELICGGSLITPNFFISVAHCFWSSVTTNRVNVKLYNAVVGKHCLSWETRDEHEQRRQINAVHIPDRYADILTRFEGDIALVKLSTPIEVTPQANVVCMDWKSKTEYQQLTTNSIGTVPGWGMTEDDVMSPTLRHVDLPFVPYMTCRDSVPVDFKNYLLGDKFCGGYRNRTTGVCQGDSGGGFVFPAQKTVGTRYFLRGVVSSGPRRSDDARTKCWAEHFSAFTKVSSYTLWLENIVFADTDGDD